MRYNVLLLALLLYNVGQDCWATQSSSTAPVPLSSSTATVPSASTHSDKPSAVKSNKTIVFDATDDDDDDGGGGGSDFDDGDGGGVNSSRSNHDGNRIVSVHVYQGKIGGQQTTSQTAVSTKPKQKPASQTSRTTYVTKSTTSSTNSHASKLNSSKTTTKTTPARRTNSPFSTAMTSHYKKANITTSEAFMEPAFVYKAIVPKHEEKKVAQPTTASYDSELDGDSSKKIIGSSVVTSVSVILNGNEPEFTDALGTKVPKPQPSLQVASPIDLLNPDRYEFYTFDDNGELVKRLMTMQEIQSIVANGDGEGPTIIHTAPIDERDPEKNVQDIVNSVQTVLHTHVESNKNTTTETLPVLDTPDVSSSWSMILPAIFGNTGGDIFPPQKPAQIIMIPETEIVEASTLPPRIVQTTRKTKPNKRKPGHKRKTTTTSTTTTTTEMTPQVVQEELGPHESVYTGMEQYQNIASNVQNFEGIPELNLKPLYQHMNEYATTDETTTRRVFVNNQEIVQVASTTTSTTTEQQPELGEQFAKKPHGAHNRQPPHRHKIPNDGIIHNTRRPQVTHTKQKIKKKPTTTTTTTTELPETTTTTTTSTTTTTTTTPPPPPPPPTTISPIPPVLTTHKKKKKKPTRPPTTQPVHTSKPVHVGHPAIHHTPKPVQPVQTPKPIHTSHPAHITKPPHAPHPTHITKPPHTPHPTHITKPPHTPHPTHITKPLHTPHPVHTSGAHDEHEIHYTKPHPHGEKRKPSTQRPKPSHQPIVHNNKHPVLHDQTAESSIHHTTSNKINHHKRPRPHKTTTTTTTSTTTTTTTTTVPPHHHHSASVIATPIGEDIIVEEYPGLPIESYISPNLLDQIKSEATTTTTTIRPLGYPVPAYDTSKPLPSIAEAFEEMQLKKQPLPSLSMIQQQYQQDSITEQPVKPITNEDLNALMSFDQLMQSLQSDANSKATEKTEVEEQKVESTKKPIVPVKYDSAESMEQLEEMAQKKKKPATATPNYPTKLETTKTPEVTQTPSTITIPIATTVNPLAVHYGGSTLATMLAGEVEGITVNPIDTSTESKSTEQPNYSEEGNDKVVIITQRPVYFATTRKPEEFTTTYPTKVEESQTETTDTPIYTQPVVEKTEQPIHMQQTTVKPTADEAHVVKFEPLYAEDTEPIIREITTTEPPMETTTINYEQGEDTTHSAFGSSESTESNESEASYTTQTFLRLPVSVPHKVDHLISEDDSSTEIPPGVADLKPNLNMEVLKPTDQILMGDFQTQAATVASTLVDGTNTIAADTFMSSNETKDEIQFLMNDVIQQIANEDQYKIAPPEPSENRLSGFAQLNSSFLLKPSKLATPSSETLDSSSSYSEGSAIVDMDATTEIPFINESTTVENDDEHEPTTSANENYKVSTEIPVVLETTTLIPSREELIKIEEDYLNSVKKDEQMATTELPPPEEESTTSRIPILSLSQIYAQQQQQELEMESMFTAEKWTNVFPPYTERPETTIDYATTERVSVVDSEDPTESTPHLSQESNESDETTHLENLYEKLHQQMHHSQEYSTENIENKPTKMDENTSTNEEKPHLDTDSEGNIYATTINASQQNSEKLPSNNYDDNQDEQQNHTNNEHVTESATIEPINETMSSAEKQSIEQIYASMINKPIEISVSNDEVLEPTDLIHSDEDEKSETGEKYPTQLTPLSEDSNTNNDENKPTYDSPNESQNQSSSLEESTKYPVQQDTVPESQTTLPPNYEQTTPAYTMNTETNEEMLDDLIASIYNKTGLEENPEDAYVKLGESTAKPLEHQQVDLTNKEVDKESTENYPFKVNTTESTLEYITSVVPNRHESQETQLQQQVANLNDEEIQIPTFSYNQNPPDQSDDEDEEDQTGYQVPVFITSSSTSSTTSTSTSTSTTTTTTSTTTTPEPTMSTTKRLNTLKPVSYYKQPAFGLYNQPEPPKVYTYAASPPQQRPMQRPAALSNLMASSTQATRPPVKLEPSPDYSKGLEASVVHLDEDVLAFAKFCNELAFSYWRMITSEKISSARSLVLSPFALTSMLSMVFLGARGGTSGEMNEVLKLDDVVTFNPHLVFKNITESVEKSTDSDIATAAFVREIFSDRSNGKILQFFKDKTQQFYAGHVEEVNFHVVNDIIRRRTNLLIKRHTMGKVLEYLRTNSVWVNGPLATISANLFQTDCSKASTHDRDGEMFFQVHPTVRQRRLVPIPAVLYKRGFTAGYEPNLDATIVAFGRIQDTVSTIYVMPGHQSSISPTDNLERMEQDLVELAFKENAWSNILTSLMDRPGMEVQLPRFSHRSFVNASLGLQKMGLKGLFKSDYANLRGLTGSSNRDIYLSDMIQINTFSTCGEERISDHHHVEMYPAPPLRKRNKDVNARGDDEYDSSEAIIDFGSLVQDPVMGRGFYDDLLDPKYLELPLPLRPRQARVPDTPRLRFDKPFLYFVRHNPTGMILFMGRFNPRLLP